MLAPIPRFHDLLHALRGHAQKPRDIGLAQRLGELEYFGAPLGVLAEFVLGHTHLLRGFPSLVKFICATRLDKVKTGEHHRRMVNDYYDGRIPEELKMNVELELRKLTEAYCIEHQIPIRRKFTHTELEQSIGRVREAAQMAKALKFPPDDAPA